MSLKIYLAGPDVFFADASEVGRLKKELCRDFGFEGLFPLDNQESCAADADRIFRANCHLMDQAAMGLFNLTPFRGPSADAGTAFEVGFMFAQRKTLYGYTSVTTTYGPRVADAFGPLRENNGRAFDVHGLAVEDFDLTDNLMIARSITASGGEILIREEPGEGGNSLASLAAFRACLALLREREKGR